MKNNILSTMYSDLNFLVFIQNNFLKEPNNNNFSYDFIKREASEDFLKKLPEIHARNIRERQIIRKNIFIDYKFDIFEFPFVVFFEKNNSKKLKPFKKYNEAETFAKKLKIENISALLIELMNEEIECKLFSTMQN